MVKKKRLVPIPNPELNLKLQKIKEELDDLNYQIQKAEREYDLNKAAELKYGKLPILGDVIDYQTPLKDIQKNNAGKIDLLTYDGQVLRILELKTPDSKETMLRCVLEAYTYLKTINAAKLLKNFSLPANTKIQACTLVHFERSQHKEMMDHRPYLEKLMKALDCKPYYYLEPVQYLIIP